MRGARTRILIVLAAIALVPLAVAGAGVGAASCADGSDGVQVVFDVPSKGRAFHLVVDGLAPPGQGPVTLNWRPLDEGPAHPGPLPHGWPEPPGRYTRPPL